ncbi:unnamed protein product, partial [Didymodactylos carnosus]
SVLDYESSPDHHNSTILNLDYETDSGIAESSSDTTLDDSHSRYIHTKPRVLLSKLPTSSKPTSHPSILPVYARSYTPIHQWYPKNRQLLYAKPTILEWKRPSAVERRVTRTNYDEYYDRLLNSLDYEQPSFTNYSKIYDINTPYSARWRPLPAHSRYYSIKRLSYDTILCKRDNKAFIAKRSYNVPKWVQRLVAILS